MLESINNKIIKWQNENFCHLTFDIQLLQILKKTLKNNFDFNWPFNLKCLTNFLSTLFFWNWQVLITLWTITIFQKRILIPKPKSFLARNYQRMSKKIEYSIFKYPNGIPRTALGCFLPDLSIQIALKIFYQPFSSEADGYWSLSEPSQ